MTRAEKLADEATWVAYLGAGVLLYGVMAAVVGLFGAALWAEEIVRRR